MDMSDSSKSGYALPEESSTARQSIYTSDAIVHTQYEYDKVPPRPKDAAQQWTRFVCLSDTHCEECPVPDGDVLLHSGDLTDTGKLQEVRQTMEWLYGLPHKIKIVIAGNHDLTLHRGWYEKSWRRWHEHQEDEEAVMELVRGQEAKEAGIVYLDCEEYQFSTKEGGKVWSVYGSPWQPQFGSWAFNYKRSQANVIVDKIPKVDILLTHGPPYNILDETGTRDRAGCKALALRLPQLQPRLHVFGHIHEGHGAYIHTWDKSSPSCPVVQAYSKETQTPDNPVGHRTAFVNASNSPMSSHWNRGAYRLPFAGPGFQPVIVDLRDNEG